VWSEDFQRRVFREDKIKIRQANRAASSSPSLCLSKIFRLRQDFLPFCARDPVQNAVHRFLDSGAGPMELARGLGGKLAKHITVPQRL
jgi:hypothetical protein